ncbi:MAG: AAA family ATPase [Nitrososphaerota archaeon]|jgi:hypothetical protein|nr:AAA family ATPase [Nitrososphaerota archaeon]
MSVKQVPAKIFVLGDKVKGYTVIPKGNSLEQHHNSEYGSSDYGSFSHVPKKLCERYGGTHMLYQIFDFAKVAFNISLLDETCCYGVSGEGTLSEWEPKPVLDDLGGTIVKSEGLFSIKDLGIYEVMTDNPSDIQKNKPISDDSLIRLNESDIVTIYNVSDEGYCAEKVLETLDKSGPKLILFRTKFYSGQRPTAFFSSFCEKPKLTAQTILFFNAAELRQGDFNVRKGLSWELLIHETVASLKIIEKNYNFRAIVVCFDYEGCLIYSKNFIKLFLYPAQIEGDFTSMNGRYVFGAFTTMQASLVLALSANDQAVASDQALIDALSSGVKTGLAAMRRLTKIGFAVEAVDFPYKKMADVIKEYYVGCISEQISSNNVKHIYPDFFELDRGAVENKNFCIIDEICRNNCLEQSTENWLLDNCKKIVREGKTESNLPYLRYNKLITYDRFEIEQFRNIYRLFRSYIRDTKADRPLSIGIFGPPGSGKSFAVEQIVASITEMGLEKTVKFSKPFMFNVSQMTEPEELAIAFQQIRDAGLRGECPIVFFDEFDSTLKKSLGWLQYFLAPMQDGKFTQNGYSYFIGRAILIFAGGLHKSMAEFKKKAEDEKYNEQKVNDFLSRLKGYINILGPNGECSRDAFSPKKLTGAKHMSKDTGQCKNCTKYASFCGCAYRLRRATLLRSLLEKKLGISEDAPEEAKKIEIDDVVLNAFMCCDRYVHGVRSLEAIIQMCDIVPGKNFSASCINAVGLEMNVDDSFMAKLYES